MEGGTEAFNLFVENGKYNLTLNGETQELGDAAAEHQHLAFSIDGSASTATYYLNGTLAGTFSYANVMGDWNAEEWQL